MSDDIEKELKYMRETFGNKINNSKFISDKLIEELESQKLENRRKLSFLSYNVGQVYYAPKNLIFESNESKNEIEVNTYFTLNKVLLGVLLTGTISVAGFKIGFNPYEFIGDVYNGLYNGVSYIFNAIGEKFNFDYINDLKKISSKIINDILPNVSEEIKMLKGFINSEKHVIETITNGIIGLFGIYATAKSEEVNIIKELVKSNNRLNKQKQEKEFIRYFRFPVNTNYMDNNMTFFAEYLYRFNVMYDFFSKKLNKMKISKENFLYTFAKKIFSNKKLYKSLYENGTITKRRSTDDFTILDVVDKNTNEIFIEKLNKKNKFRELYKSFQNYVIDIQELKKYNYKEKVELFKKSMEKTKKDNEVEIIRATIYSSLLTFDSESLNELFKKYKENELSPNEENYLKNKKDIVKAIKIEKEIINESLKNIIKISKINDYCASANQSYTHLFEYSKMAILIIDKIKKKKSIDCLDEYIFNVEKKIKEIINNEQDEFLINQEIKKNEKIKIKTDDIYVEELEEVFKTHPNVAEIFSTNAIEIINEEMKKFKDKLNNIKKVDNYGLEDYNKIEFNNIINSNICSLLMLIEEYSNRNGKKDTLILKYKDIDFKKKYNLNFIKNFQIDYLNNLLKIATNNNNIEIKNLDIEEKKKIIIDFLEKNIKEIMKEVDYTKRKHICIEYNNDLIDLNVKKSIIQLIIEENYDRIFKVNKDRNNQFSEINLSKIELLKTFFDLLLFKEKCEKGIFSAQSIYPDYNIKKSYDMILEKFKYINKEDLFLYFEDIKNIEDENIDIYYNILNSNELIKNLIDKKIDNFKKHFEQLEHILNINYYVIKKIKNNEFALFDDYNNGLQNMMSKKENEERMNYSQNMTNEKELIIKYFKMEKKDLSKEEKLKDKEVIKFLVEKKILVEQQQLITESTETKKNDNVNLLEKLKKDTNKKLNF